MSKKQLFGLEFWDTSMSEFISELKLFLSDNVPKAQKLIFTPNPEMLVLANKNNEFKKVLEMADYLLADGFGLKLWSKILFKNSLKNILTGSDLVSNILNNPIGSIFIIGGLNGAAEKVKSQFSQTVVGFFDGVVTEESSNSIIEQVKKSEAQIVLVALGAPKQEFWIYQYAYLMPNVKVFAGIGGAIDFESGIVKRAPRFFRLLGLEWLWRLFLEPKRIVRIWNAVVVFSFQCIKKKLFF